MVKRKLKNSIKLKAFITALILVFVVFLLLNGKSHSYEMSYTIGDVKVIEKYDNKDKYYTFNIKYLDIDTNIFSLASYNKSRHLIKDINVTNVNNNICLDFSTKGIALYPICHNNEGYYTKYIDNDTIFKEQDSYNNVLIDNLNNYTYLLWNYNGFMYINNKSKYNIDLFKKDTYNLNLFYQYNNYMLIPDYNQEWTFDRLYMININNGKTNSFKMRFPVYFDSYFLGNQNDNVYIFDRKEEQEYYFDIKKDDIFKVGNKVLINNKWENVSKQKLKNKEVLFVNDKVFDYYLKDDVLYATGDLKITNRKIDSLVKVDGLNAFYLSDGILYMFNPLKGEKSVLKYSEWEFNSNNMIFIY